MCEFCTEEELSHPVCTVNQDDQYFNLNVPRDLKHGCVCFTPRDKDFSDHDTLGLTACRD